MITLLSLLYLTYLGIGFYIFLNLADRYCMRDWIYPVGIFGVLAWIALPILILIDLGILF